MARTNDSFPGFPKEALPFLKGLAKNNEREWFEKRRPIFEEKLKQPMIDFAEALGRRMVDFAPDYIPEPKKAVMRIYRDIRFSKNKTPYKTNIAADFHRQNLSKGEGASFYIQLDPKELMIAAGVYMPPPEYLKALRLFIASHHEEMRKLIANKTLVKLMGNLQGDSLTRTPKGFLPGDPAEDLLRRKMFLFHVSLPPELAESPRVLNEAAQRMKAVAPFVEFLNRPLAGKRPTHAPMQK